MLAVSLAALWSASVGIWSNPKWLEFLSALSTIILVVGAVIEEWPKLQQIGALTAKVVAFCSTQYDRYFLKKLLAHSLGAILVVVGIAGELIFETRTFIVEDRETATLQKEAGDAKRSAQDASVAAGQAVQSLALVGQEAADAHALARSASDIATPVKETADKAKREAVSSAEKAASVEKKAEELNEELATAQKRVKEIQDEINDIRRWRGLTPEQQKDLASRVSAALPPDRRFDVMVAAVPLTVESGKFAQQILNAVQTVVPGARWFPGRNEIGPMTGAGAVESVVVFSTKDQRSIKVAEAIWASLMADGVMTFWQPSLQGCEKVPTTDPNDVTCFHVLVAVGPKLL